MQDRINGSAYQAAVEKLLKEYEQGGQGNICSGGYLKWSILVIVNINFNIVIH